ncbi:hypothetical protein N9W89_11785 [Hellea sp.]|nr:hypothetical protein [Hellea sp.]
MPKCLLVEHDPLIATDLYMMLDDNGYQVDGPHGDIKAVLSHIDGATYEIAALDVNIMGESIGPVASELARKDVPIVYISGTDPEDPIFSDLPKGDLLPKPFNESDLITLMDKNLA